MSAAHPVQKSRNGSVPAAADTRPRRRTSVPSPTSTRARTIHATSSVPEGGGSIPCTIVDGDAATSGGTAYRRTATASISTLAPAGSAATPTVARAGYGARK